MKHFKISLFALFALFVCCCSLNAQNPVEDEPFEVEIVDVQVSDPHSPQWMPPISTITRLTQFMLEEELQGKTLFSRFETQGLEYRNLIGLSESQSAHIASQNNLFFKEHLETFMDCQEQLVQWADLPADEFSRIESEYMDFHRKLIDHMETTYRETLTPVQLQNAMEYELAAPSNFFPFLGDEEDNEIDMTLNFSAYELLDLSEEQKKTMQEFQEEIKTELKTLVEEFMQLTLESIANTQPSVQKETREENEQNMLKKTEKLNEKGKALSQKNREKINEILTQEQKDRLATIREEVPKKLASIREELAKKAKETPEDESWKNSWKPGDPLPEGAVPPQRKPRFPFKL